MHLRLAAAVYNSIALWSEVEHPFLRPGSWQSPQDGGHVTHLVQFQAVLNFLHLIYFH